jgi:hypothetical protein
VRNVFFQVYRHYNLLRAQSFIWELLQHNKEQGVLEINRYRHLQLEYQEILHTYWKYAEHIVGP